MITSRLSTLCGERRVKMTEVARATGLSRNTVMALYHDRASRFDRDTLDALCRYLGVGIGELLVYTPERERPESQLRMRL